MAMVLNLFGSILDVVGDTFEALPQIIEDRLPSLAQYFFLHLSFINEMLLDIVHLAVMILGGLIVEGAVRVHLLTFMMVLLEPNLIVNLVGLFYFLDLRVVTLFVIEYVLEGHDALLVDEHHVLHLHYSIGDAGLSAVSVVVEKLFEVNCPFLVVLENVLRFDCGLRVYS